MPNFLTLIAAAQLGTVHFAPQPALTLVVHPGEQIALCGDSITEQRQYSRIIETYLRACEPGLNVDFRQFGWSGETWTGFLARLDQDVLRFKPTLALTVYGMNDHGYAAINPAIDDAYTANTQAGVLRFKKAGSRVVICSPNSIGKVPSWAGKATVPEMNTHLTRLARICQNVAAENHVGFIDNNAVMFNTAQHAKEKFGPGYCLEGGDGVHPDWAGHMVMAYGLLKGLGFKGDLGAIYVSLKGNGTAKGENGHRVISVKKGVVTVVSSRFPFYIPVGDAASNHTMASAVALVPFQRDLNRFRLVLNGATKPYYRVAWGNTAHLYSRSQMAKGINLAEEFPVNPLTNPFVELDHAVAAKQAFETIQIKTLFRSVSGKDELDWMSHESELMRDQLIYAIKQRQQPVTHTISITVASSKR